MNATLFPTDSRFESASAAVENSQNLGELRTSVLDLLNPYGLRHAVYHALSIPSAGIEQDVIVFTYPTDWVKHYLARRYYNIDPVIHLGKRSILPIDWQHIDKSLPMVTTLFREAEEAGIGRHGLTIPIRGVAGDEAMFTVTSDMSDSDWMGLKRLICRDMQVIAHYVHARVMQLYATGRPRASINLNNREIEVLKWAACGKTVPETSMIIGLSPSTIKVYLDSARHKLDCISKPQAVAKALRLGLISG